MMNVTNGSHLGSVGGGMLVAISYWLFFWRVFKENPGNRLVECGCLTLIVFMALIPITRAGGSPGWLFGAWLILILLLCFATLFFLFQRMFRALARR
jgi:hypothetical protein